MGFLPNALRFCCGGLRRPPPSRLTYPAAGRRAQAPVSSKRGLGSGPTASEALSLYKSGRAAKPGCAQGFGCAFAM